MWFVKFRDICEDSTDNLKQRDWLTDSEPLFGPFDTVNEAEEFLIGEVRKAAEHEFPEGFIVQEERRGMRAVSLIEHGLVVIQGQVHKPMGKKR